MRLYAGTTDQFILDNTQNQMSEKLKQSYFEYFRYYPSVSEVRSWNNSLKNMTLMVQYANLHDNGIIVEFQLPMTSRRLDCLITGKDISNKDNAVIVELKQWESCVESSGENEVITFVGGAKREVLHPSVQVGQYQMYLADNQEIFYDEENPVGLKACAYLHNYPYDENDVIYAGKFSNVLNEFPLFTKDEVNEFKSFLTDNLSNGNGMEILSRIDQSKYRPSRKLMEQISTTIRTKSEYVLLDDQLIVYDKVFAAVKIGFHDRKKRTFIIKGGPGTGKSVIAINLMADLLRENYNTHYATGSKAFTQTLRKIIGRNSNAQFKYFNSYGGCQNNEIDVLVCDESHRIRKSSNSIYTPRAQRADMLQIDELITASKVSVFFIDDAQIVRPNEIGSVEYIRQHAISHNCEIEEYELENQFRCNGSDGFINWVDNTLQVRRTANVLWNSNESNFDFKIMRSPLEVENAIKGKIAEGYSARMTAGFCWEWSSQLDLNGILVNDVNIGDYKRPWNARDEMARLPNNVPKASYWAYDPQGINQIGCIYTVQGFEFDYIGVIFGNDMRYDFENNAWIGIPGNSYDTVVKNSRDKFIDLVKNTYRVLLTRGIKGCYVCFLDKDTERFVQSRIEKNS